MDSCVLTCQSQKVKFGVATKPQPSNRCRCIHGGICFKGDLDQSCLQMIQRDGSIHHVCLTNHMCREPPQPQGSLSLCMHTHMHTHTHIHTLASSVNQPAAAAARWVRVLQQGHQLSFEQAEVLLLAAITLPLQLVQTTQWVVRQQRGALLLSLMLHLQHLEDSVKKGA